jgi:hypothetical protein
VIDVCGRLTEAWPRPWLWVTVRAVLAAVIVGAVPFCAIASVLGYEANPVAATVFADVGLTAGLAAVQALFVVVACCFCLAPMPGGRVPHVTTRTAGVLLLAGRAAVLVSNAPDQRLTIRTTDCDRPRAPRSRADGTAADLAVSG